MKVLAYAVLGAYTIVVAYPILFMFFTSFKSNKEFFVNLFGLPQNVEIMNYAKAWSVGKLGIYNLARAYPPSSETMVVTATDTTVTNTLFPKYVPSFPTLHAFA